MARLSFGSHHFQAQSNRNALQLESAQRVVKNADELSHESVEDDPLNDTEVIPLHNTRARPIELDHVDRNNISESREESEAENLKSQINLLTKSNSELLDRISTLKDENNDLKDALKQLRAQLQSIQKLNLIDDLESTVLSTFAKILDRVQKLKNNHIDANHEQNKPEQTSMEIKDNLTSKANPSETEMECMKSTPVTIERRLDFLDLTFFKPTGRDRPSIKRKSFVVKSEKVKDSRADTMSNFKTESQQQPMHGDKLYGTDYEGYLEEDQSLNLEHHREEMNTSILTSSTPHKKTKRLPILDIYGDEIHVGKKTRSDTLQSLNPSNKECTATKELVKDTNARGSKRVLANITNRKKLSKTNEKPSMQTVEPVDKSIFEYVDENVLMEQTQNLVKTIRDKLK